MNGRDRILIVIAGPLPPPHHGVTVHTEMLLNSRLKDEFRLLHVDTSDHRNLDNIGRFDFGNVASAIRSIGRLKWLCVTRRPSIVYLPNSQNNLGFFRDGLLVLVARVLSRAKIVMHYHGGESFTPFMANTNAFMRWYIRFILGKVDLAIVVGERLRGIFSGVVRETAVVPNGISFLPAIDGKFDLRRETVVVSYLGNLFESKGVLDLLDAALIVRERCPGVRFRFAGQWWRQEPDTKARAMKFIDTHKLSDVVEFKGVQIGPEKERFLIESDILAFPTWNDSFGIVNLEAMAAGCPVISTRGVGAIDEVVVDGVTGILIEKQNPKQLADAIVMLAENPELRHRMGKAGRERLEKHYTFDRVADQLTELFRTMLRHGH